MLSLNLYSSEDQPAASKKTKITTKKEPEVKKDKVKKPASDDDDDDDNDDDDGAFNGLDFISFNFGLDATKLGGGKTGDIATPEEGCAGLDWYSNNPVFDLGLPLPRLMFKSG